MRHRRKAAGRQRGQALMVVLIMLVAILMLTLSGARNALLAEKASRNDRDRQQALRAAEAALLDAEADILEFATGERREVFAGRAAAGVAPGDCHGQAGHPLAGICRSAPIDTLPVWSRTGLADPEHAGAAVRYGHQTGQYLGTGAGPLPSQLPRYIIEVLDTPAGQPGAPHFRNTAAGFGARDASRVVLQSRLRTLPGQSHGERYAWREITDWSSNEQTKQ